MPNSSSPEILHKTIFVVDMISYSSIGRLLAQSVGVNAVAELNRKIQSFVDLGLAAASATREQHVMSATGHGAILLLDSAIQAHHFGEGFHRAAHEGNITKTEVLAKTWFRAGAATGALSRAVLNGAEEYAGTSIADAVRLETATARCDVLDRSRVR